MTSVSVSGRRPAAAVAALTPAMKFPGPGGKVVAKAVLPRDTFRETSVSTMAALPSEDILRSKEDVVDAGSGMAILDYTIDSSMATDTLCPRCGSLQASFHRSGRASPGWTWWCPRGISGANSPSSDSKHSWSKRKSFLSGVAFPPAGVAPGSHYYRRLLN